MIEIGRRPLLILWGTIVAERLGFDRDEALTLGRAIASLGGRMTDSPPDVMMPAKIAEARVKLHPGQTLEIALLDRVVCMMKEPDGLRAVVKNRLIDPASVERYLGEQFGDRIDSVAGAMISLAETLPPSQLMECAWELYERFRPEADGLDIDRITASIRSNPGEDALTAAQWTSNSRWDDAQGEMPSFRGPQALMGRAIPSDGVEPVRDERAAYHAPPRPPARMVDTPTAKPRKWVIEPSASSRPVLTRPPAASVPRPMVARAVAAPMWPLTLVLSIFLAGAIGGGVGALLVSPPQQAGLVSELRSLLASYQHTSPPTSQMTEPDSSAAYSEPSANARRGSEPIASEMPTAPSETPGYLLVDNHGASEAARTEPDNEAPRRAPVAVEISVTPSDTANGTPESPPIDNPGPSDIARAETDDEAPSTPPLAVETSTSSSNPVSTTPESPPLDNQGASDVAETAHADEAPGSAPIAVDMPAAPSNPVNRTPESLPVDNHGVSDNARIAMERGDERMRRGDVASARRFYETAAATGMIEAATAIGRTFDPLYLRRIGVRGALADARRAKQWYEKAARAGDVEAQARIELMTFGRSNQ